MLEVLAISAALLTACLAGLHALHAVRPSCAGQSARRLACAAIGCGSVAVALGAFRWPAQLTESVSIRAAAMGLSGYAFALYSQEPSRRLAVGLDLYVALAMVALAADPVVVPGVRSPSGLAFSVGALLETAAAGPLLVAVAQLAGRPDEVNTTKALVALSACLMLGAGASVAQGLGAQQAWGGYWSWDPVECWRLAARLTSALAYVVLMTYGYASPWPRWTLLPALVLYLAWGPGAPWWARLMGLQSAYLR